MKKTSLMLVCSIALFCFFLSGECHATAHAYISNSPDDTVSVIEISDNTLIATIDVGDGPMGMAVHPNGDYVYVANDLDDTGSVIITSDHTVTGAVNVGNSPIGFGTFIGRSIPEAPTDLVASAVSTSQIDLSWTDNSNDELGFRIERKTYGGTFSIIATVGANVTTSYSDTGLSTYRTYFYRVGAYNDAGTSYSDEASAATLDEEASGCFANATAYGLTLDLDSYQVRKGR